MTAGRPGAKVPADEVSVPSESLVEQVSSWDDVVILGAGGKMGAGISSMLASAFAASGNRSTVHAVSRWSDRETRSELVARGVAVVEADVSDPALVATLPDADRVIFLVGAKFGTTGTPDTTWMTNTVLPATVASHYATARISALSTGNVYPYTPGWSGGADESTRVAPIGEYAMSCLGRERVFENAARRFATPVSIIRLNYACELRYGVLADIGRRVWAGEPVDVSVGAVNVVWQRYANEVIIRALDIAASPPTVLNLAGPETASVRWIAGQFADRFGKGAIIEGIEQETGLLSNAARCHQLFGYPELSILDLIDKQADWISSGGELWSKPTKFERIDGKF